MVLRTSVACALRRPASLGGDLARPSRMSDARVTLGKLGEDLAVAELERRGYEILDRRYRRRGGEIDIIARDGKTTVFVEVKTRERLEFGDGSESVRSWKQRRMICGRLNYPCLHNL